MHTAEEKALHIIEKLEEEYPDARIHLDYETPLQLLVATMLAARCTDKKVNEVTPRLWEEFPNAGAVAAAEPEKLYAILRPTGFFRQKTANIQKVCKAINEEYGGVVPDDISQLIALPGVGRKTANVLLANAYGGQTIPVDTHVGRVSTRLGLAPAGSADAIEKKLCELLPEEKYSTAALAMGEHGRTICKSQNPDCPNCPVNDLCDYYLRQAR